MLYFRLIALLVSGKRMKRYSFKRQQKLKSRTKGRKRVVLLKRSGASA